MRKSNSLLKNVSNPQGNNPAGSSAIMAHAEQIQQRLNRIASQQAASYQPMPAYAPQTASNNHFSRPEMLNEQGGPADSQLQSVKANLDKLAQKLSLMNQSREMPDTGQTTEYELLRQHLGMITNSLGELKSTFSALQSNSIQPAQVISLKDSIEQSYRDIVSRLEGVRNDGIDPSAYAKVVETSHADIINQVKQVQSSVRDDAIAAVNLAERVEVGYDALSSRIDQLNASFTGLDRQSDGEWFGQIQNQLSSLDSAIEELGAREIKVPLPDFSQIELRLEEVNRAIVALSSMESGTDNLDRIEARLIDLSREMDALANRGDIEVKQPDFSAIENQFAQTGVALREIEERILDKISASKPDFGNFSDEIRHLADKIENISVFSSGSGEFDEGNNPALLERLDVLASRELPMPAIDFSGLEERIDAVNAALTEIGGQITGQSGAPAYDFGEISAEIQKLGEKIDAIPTRSMDGELQVTQTDPVLLDRVDEMVQRIELMQGHQSGDGENSISLLQSLQQQIVGISEQLGDFSTTAPSLGPITESLGSIEQQLAASRDISIELAASAAEEAVRRVIHEIPGNGSAIDPEIITALHQDIEKLNETMVPANRTEVPIDDLKDVLGAIAQRLGSLETSIHTMQEQGFVSADQPQVDEPEYHPVEPEVQDFVEIDPEPVVEPEPAQEIPAEPDLGSVHQQETLQVPQSIPDEEPYSNQDQEDGLDNQKMSAGERLVKAARMAEQERRRAKQEYQEEFAAMPSSRDFADADTLASRAHSLAEENQAAQSHIPEPEPMASYVPPAPMQDHVPDEEYEEDAPIEPGSSGPDLAALVRQANAKRKTLSDREEGVSGTDFLAAARKAAQAAALEASVQEAEAEAAKPQKSEGLLASVTGMVSKRKKAIAIAAGAILLTAIAVPVVSNFVFIDNGDSGAQLAETVIIPESVETALIEPVVGSDLDLPEDRLSVVSEFVKEEQPEILPLEPLEKVGSISSSGFVQTASLSAPVIDPLPFDDAKFDFASEPLKLAVEQNDPAAVFEIGRRYTNGIEIEKNLEEAARWYEHSAKLGFIPAQYLIGNFSEKGIGVPADRTIAEAWYEQAAQSGHVIAMHNLAVLSASPDPTTGTTDLDKAYEWFLKAAQHGVRDSQVNMGIFLAKGTGVPVDLVESYKWFAIAAKSGDKDAGKKRDFIADALRPDQLEEARKRLDNWKQIEPDAAANKVNIPDSWKSNEDRFALLTDQKSVAEAQLLLTRLGFDVGPADGIIGQKTRQAIAAFRSKSGLAVNENLDTEFMETLKAVSI
ncbi:MAG: peptidoglycan-binding protein [Pseudomonadota bacterium]